MPVLDLIRVRVLVNGQPLVEYNDPEKVDTYSSATRYVEALPGQNYAIEVSLLSGLDTHRAQYIRTDFWLDSQGRWTAAMIPYHAMKQQGMLIQDVMVQTIDHVIGFDNTTKQFLKYAISFNSLQAVEDDYLPENLSREQASLLGSIRVHVCRAKLSGSSVISPETYVIPEAVDTLSEKVLKGADIHATTKYRPEQLIRPPASQQCFVPIDGDEGKKAEFTFLYRSKEALQHLGLINPPRSPTPDKSDIKQAKAEEIKREKALPSTQLSDKETKKGNKREFEPKGFGECDDGSDLEEIAPPAKKPKVSVQIEDD